jgi:hypothetical protein
VLHDAGCERLPCNLLSHRESENARGAVAAKRRDLERHTNALPAKFADIVRDHDRHIVEHERMSRVHARRAEHVESDGIMPLSPDEGTDADHQRAYDHLSAAMRSAGHLRVIRDRIEPSSVEDIEAMIDEAAAAENEV